jgi:ceramide glucosyltransferase
VLVTYTLCALTLLSIGLLAWQLVAAMRFPLHRRGAPPVVAPGVTMLKPLKGCDGHTRDCLRSWLTQRYPGAVQVLFGVADDSDPACAVVRELMKEFPRADAELVITGEPIGANAKVSNLAQLLPRARHRVFCVSDADVFAPDDLLAQTAALLGEPNVGLVNCLYRIANPSTPALRWEAMAVNADFWSQVLQSNTIKPQAFALGAVMMLRAEDLASAGGFESLLDYLADDYQLGQRIAAAGKRVALSTVVVECREKPAGFAEVWQHQLRWARTIRASQPVPYFFSILSNVTLWATLFASAAAWVLWRLTDSWNGPLLAALCFSGVLILRVASARVLASRLAGQAVLFSLVTMILIKDVLQVGIWACSFLGNRVEWRGRVFRITAGGKLKERTRRNVTPANRLD